MITDEPRVRPFVWATWITGLLSGDKHCAWAAWYRAHFLWTKRPEEPESHARLRVWKGEHSDLVRQRAGSLRAAGWHVNVEGQNKITVNGRTGTLSCAPDIVAVTDGADLLSDEVPDETPRRAVDLSGAFQSGLQVSGPRARVEDGKTGARKDADFWQVLVYMTFVRASDRRIGDRPIEGAIAYTDGLVPIPSATVTPETTARISAQVLLATSLAAPPPTPSFGECRYCDILACRNRVDEDVAAVETEDF